MLGRKKKQEEADKAPNDLDKPQTLAELDAMAREKKDDKVMLADDDGSDAEHEMTHSDQLSADVDVKKVTKSQKKLWVLVFFAVIALMVGGVLFYEQLEDGEGIGIGAGGEGIDTTDGDDDDESVLPRGTYAYTASPGDSSYKRHNLETSDQSDIGLGGRITNKNRSFQLSSNSLVSAVSTGSGISIKNLEEESTVLADKVSQISDWILIPDGTKIYALIGSDLHSYDTTSGEGGIVAQDFNPPGGDSSPLGYSRDGSILKYSKNGGQIIGTVYDIATAEVENLDREVIRLERMGPFAANSVSPDGTSIIFSYEINGNQTLQLLSLNSFVLRTIYVAEPGNQPTSYSWSADSNNLAIFEGNTAPLLSNLKVGTLEKEIVLENSGALSSLSWSPDKKHLSFIKNNKLQAIRIEDKEVIDLIDSVKSGSATGWIQN